MTTQSVIVWGLAIIIEIVGGICREYIAWTDALVTPSKFHLKFYYKGAGMK